MKILCGIGLLACTPFATMAAEAPAASAPSRPASPAATNPPAVLKSLAPAQSAPPLLGPCGLALDKDGNLFISDIDNELIYKLTPQGQLTIFAGKYNTAGFADGLGATAAFNLPTNLVVDKDGNILVSDADNSAVRKITPGGVVTTLVNGYAMVTSGGGSVVMRPAPLEFPSGLALDAAGNAYVADTVNNIVSKIASSGVLSILAGKPGMDGSVDGKATEVRFGLPRAVAVDSAGIVYVADEEFSTIRKIAPDGSVTTLAGNPNLPEGTPGRDGTGIAAVFNSPRGLTLDPKGNVYVADTNSHTIRKITPEGVVTTLAGKAGLAGNADGKGDAARFNQPRGLAVDKDGNIFVADTGNSRIRKITPEGVVTTVFKPAPSNQVMENGNLKFNPP